MEKKSRLTFALTILMAILCGLLHRKQVSTLFEYDTDFSNLSVIGKEMSFEREMGFYYSYFKTIIDSETFYAGISRVEHDNISQYPDTIDALSRYTLGPEAYIGLTYHVVNSLGFTQNASCWSVDSKDGSSTITSCDEIDVPIYFYLEFVWLCAFATGSTIFLYSSNLSGSVGGGMISFMLFLFSYDESTRVQRDLTLSRETFAYPVLLFQMYVLSELLKRRKKPIPTSIYVDLIILTICCLSSWRFSQLIFITQTLSIIFLKWLRIIDKEMHSFYCIIHLSAIALVATITKNIFILKSLHLALIIVSYCSCKLSNYMRRRFESGEMKRFEIIFTIVCAKLWKDYFFTSNDDENILSILRSKLFDQKDFHSMFYSCSPEFFLLDVKTYEILIKTLLLPTAVLAGSLILYYWYRNGQFQGFLNCIESDIAYNFLQLGAIAILAIFVIRLKLFLTPLLCIFTGLVCSKRYLNNLKMSRLVQTLVIGLLFFAIAHKFLISVTRARTGEHRNSDQEELLQWIKQETPENSAFAGTAAIMSSVMLSTGRPIVNNPFYERREMQERIAKTYEVFGRKTPDELHAILKRLKADYVILDETSCLANGPWKSGCKMLELWDAADKGRAKYEGKIPVCPILFHGDAHPFRRIFENKSYVVLQLDAVQTVAYTPKIVSFKS